MKKNDKIVVVLGVIILVLASIGIWFYDYEEKTNVQADMEEFFEVKGEYKELLNVNSITVSDTDPFYPLIASPLAVNYDSNGEQNVVPLYIKDYNDPSDSVVRLQYKYLDHYRPISFNEEDYGSAENLSLFIAENYWEKSSAAMIIEDSMDGYILGVNAVPMASYLSIPVIVTDEINEEIKQVLSNLEVKKLIVCGDNIKGFEESYSFLKFNDVDEIVEESLNLVTNIFGKNDYITITNPMDAFEPEVLDEEIVLYEEGVLKNTGNPLPSHLLDALKGQSAGKIRHSFEIPEDYKYARVNLDIINLEDERYVEDFGDSLALGGQLTGYMRTSAYPAKRNENGDIIRDRLHFETVFYDMAGEKLSFSLSPTYHLLDSAKYEVKITVEEISNPYTPMMEKFSSIAPYLTAYHKGIIFAKPDFAFAPTDEVKYNGKTIPGNTQVFYNPKLIPVVNKHVYENIHKPINNLLAKIKNVDISETVEYLQEDCYASPINVCLLGDTIMLPQYYYRSPHSDPFDHPASGNYGTNCPSDFIYGNVDPEIYSMQPYNDDDLEDDLYTDFPKAENIVGRITGWDTQDASALILRTIFYDEIIDDFGDWKDNAAVLAGAGAEVQRLPIFNGIQNLLGKTEPMKFPTGEKYFLVQRILKNFEEGGFDGESAMRSQAQREGYTTQQLLEIKKDGLLNRLLFPFWSAKIRQGIGNSDSIKDPDWWKEVLFGDSSDLVIGGELEKNSNLIISDSHAIWFTKEYGDILMDSVGIPVLYPLVARYLQQTMLRTPLANKGAFTVRDVSNVEMGPSVMLVEGCGSGKIDGLLPENFLANAYLHAGVNSYVSPTTFSAFYGALEPRPDFNGGVGFGIAGYLKAKLDARKGIYPEVNFNQFNFEETMNRLFEDDATIGHALRDAKNLYLEECFDKKFRWRPVLQMSMSLPEELRDSILESQGSSSSGGSGMGNFPVEKYCTIYQLNLLGDPAFNPYEPCNRG